MLYTKGVTDINYERNIFALILIAALLFKCFRMPYMAVTNAIGHFKQTRNGAFFEAGINIAISLILVAKYGIIGVMVGTLFSMVFRTFQYAAYMSKHVIKRSFMIFVKRLFFAIANVTVIITISKFLPIDAPNNYWEWAINATVMSLIAIILVLGVELLFYRKDLSQLINMFKKNVLGRV
jgi:O-antigen/teichoic acid export membrane protein